MASIKLVGEEKAVNETKFYRVQIIGKIVGKLGGQNNEL